MDLSWIKFSIRFAVIIKATPLTPPWVPLRPSQYYSQIKGWVVKGQLRDHLRGVQ